MCFILEGLNVGLYKRFRNIVLIRKHIFQNIDKNNESNILKVHFSIIN
jgi:hypothetical protein